MGLEDDASSAKRLKKKKKKKHRHKDKERKDREKDKSEQNPTCSKDPLALDQRHSGERPPVLFDTRDFHRPKSEEYKSNTSSYTGKRFDSSNRSFNSKPLGSNSLLQGRAHFSHSISGVMKDEEGDSDISDI